MHAIILVMGLLLALIAMLVAHKVEAFVMPHRDIARRVD